MREQVVTACEAQPRRFGDRQANARMTNRSASEVQRADLESQLDACDAQLPRQRHDDGDWRIDLRELKGSRSIGRWCERGESNPHGRAHRILSPVGSLISPYPVWLCE